MKKITAKFPGVKVMVVDDYPINLELATEMLRIMECDVDMAEDGQEAIDLCKNNNYAVIFMDIQMPKIDGYTATKMIREMEGDDKHTVIVAITANALQGDREKCLDAGMDDYISKPIQGENIEKILQKYVK